MDYKEAAAIFATIIGEIDFQKLTAAKDFSALKLKPIKESDKKVGEMNNLEKAVFALIALKVEEWHKRFPDTRHEYLEAFFCGRKISEIDRQLESQVYILNNLGWQLIESRLNLQNHSLAIRAGYEIIDEEFSGRRDISLF